MRVSTMEPGDTILRSLRSRRLFSGQTPQTRNLQAGHGIRRADGGDLAAIRKKNTSGDKAPIQKLGIESCRSIDFAVPPTL